MPRWLKLILKIIGGIFVFIILLSLGAAYYINTHKKELIQKITKELSEDIIGTLTIEDISPELIRGFPAISVSLKNVLLRDSLFDTHHRDLLKADNVYVAVDALSLLHTPHIRSVEVTNASIYLFTDSAGYSNTNIFRKRDTSQSKKNKKPKIDHAYMRNVNFTFENKFKAKLFQFDIHDMETKLDYTPAGWTASGDFSALVKSFAFNTLKGSYIKNKELVMDINLEYSSLTHVLTVPKQPVTIGRDELNIGGSFDFSQTPGSFVLNIATNSIMFQNAAGLLSQSISSKLEKIKFKEPVSVSANINGHMKFRDTPVVHVTMTVRNNTLITPAAEIKNISFTGTFNNHYYPSRGYKDDNACIALRKVKGSWENIHFTADTIDVQNLLKPVLQGVFKSQFPLDRLNPIIGSNTFTIKSGNADIYVRYKGGLLSTDTTTSSVYGRAQISDAAITYLPRHIAFANTSALVTFNGTDVFFEKTKVQCGTTLLSMNGSILNFMSLYYKSPDKLLLDWNISSHRIDLREFMTFLSSRQASAAPKPDAAPGKNSLTHISQQLDNILAASNVHMKLQVDKLLHRNFVADNITADIHMEQKRIVLNNVGVDNGGGHIDLRGYIGQDGPINNFQVTAGIINVRIPEFFKSFDNFGQDAITDKNLMGRLYAKVNMTGSIRDTGSIVPRSFNGKVDFEVNDGALINFGPFLKISKFIFRKRDLGNVRFSSLKNSLDVKGDKIYIPTMMIESSAINVQVGGVYSLTKGTDLDIDIPLRNPKNDELIVDDSLKLERNMKGIVIHLNAVDGDDGNVKIKLRLKKKDRSETTNNPDNTNEPGAAPAKKKLGKRIMDKFRRK